MIEPDNLELSSRTLERYLKIFREKEHAMSVMAIMYATAPP